MKTITVKAASRNLEGSVRLPSSKSISNRLLMIRALSGMDFPIHNLSEADDTRLLNELLMKVAVANPVVGTVELDANNAGTVIRFLTAYLATQPGTWLLTGSFRMMSRPVGALTEALITLGADIEYLSSTGYPPILVRGKRLKGGDITIDAGISSQFISALMMIAPILPQGLTIRFDRKPVSAPFIKMTASVMHDYGIEVHTGTHRVAIPHGRYRPIPGHVESDWSAAAFWYEAAALSERADILLPGLKRESIQGDSVITGIFDELGVETQFLHDGVRIRRHGRRTEFLTCDFSDHPDLAPAVLTTCAALGVKGEFTGLEGLKIKESDRLAALETELRIFRPTWTGRDITLFSTHKDHRLAMAYAPLALVLGQVEIEDPQVVSKSYPGFWREMEKMGFGLG